MSDDGMRLLGDIMTDKERIIADAVEAACKKVFQKVYSNGKSGPDEIGLKWPEGADSLPGTSATQWRQEERDALLPALKVLEDAGVLVWEPQPAVSSLDNSCLVALSSVRPHIDRDDLYALPPWRAAAWARVAARIGVMTKTERDGIVREAQYVGGNGSLKPWADRTEHEKERGVHWS